MNRCGFFSAASFTSDWRFKNTPQKTECGAMPLSFVNFRVSLFASISCNRPRNYTHTNTHLKKETASFFFNYVFGCFSLQNSYVLLAPVLLLNSQLLLIFSIIQFLNRLRNAIADDMFFFLVQRWKRFTLSLVNALTLNFCSISACQNEMFNEPKNIHLRCVFAFTCCFFSHSVSIQ